MEGSATAAPAGMAVLLGGVAAAPALMEVSPPPKVGPLAAPPPPATSMTMQYELAKVGSLAPAKKPLPMPQEWIEWTAPPAALRQQ